MPIHNWVSTIIRRQTDLRWVSQQARMASNSPYSRTMWNGVVYDLMHGDTLLQVGVRYSTYRSIACRAIGKTILDHLQNRNR